MLELLLWLVLPAYLGVLCKHRAILDDNDAKARAGKGYPTATKGTAAWEIECRLKRALLPAEATLAERVAARLLDAKAAELRRKYKRPQYPKKGEPARMLRVDTDILLAEFQKARNLEIRKFTACNSEN